MNAPWLRVAAESRWRVLRHLEHERREAVRRFLEAHVAHLDRVIEIERERLAA